MSYYLIVIIRKINSLCFTTNVFLSNICRAQGDSLLCIYSFRSSHQRYSLKKGVLKNFLKFLRTFFYRTPPNNCFFLLLSPDNLLTGQKKIDLCYIKSSFQIYQFSFLNYFKTNEKMGSNHQSFYSNAPFFQDGGYKTRRIIKYFSKETKKMNLFV